MRISSPSREGANYGSPVEATPGGGFLDGREPAPLPAGQMAAGTEPGAATHVGAGRHRYTRG
ncbi:UNVERIFIED_ORG: hypothetical protein J2X79_004259 [Arthrobacter globiformis]|nr:hypothetical protein [Arthrobacter globiformis]